MSQTSTSLKRTYMKLAVKSPILVITVVFITIAILYFFTVTSSMDIFTNFNGELKVSDANDSYIEIVLGERAIANLNFGDRAYWYFDKQAAVYNAKISDIKNHDGKITIDIKPNSKDIDASFKSGKLTGKKVTVEIKTGSEKLLDRLLRKGVRKNDTK